MKRHLLTISDLSKKTEFRLALAAVLILSLIPLNFGRYDRVAGAVADAGHFWFYFIAYFYLERVSTRPKRLLLALIIISGLIELIQPYVDRDGNLQDFVVSSLGAICGYLFKQNYPLFLRIIVTASCSIPLFFPIYWRVEALQYQERMFPVLSGFKDSEWKNLWDVTAPDKGPSSTMYVNPNGDLVIRAIPGKVYPGVTYLNQYLSWADYENLEIRLEFFEDTTISMRVDDDGDCKEFNNRFNKTYPVRSGINLIKIPFDELRMTLGGRIMNITKIKRLALFTGGRGRAEKIFAVKEMKLTKD